MENYFFIVRLNDPQRFADIFGAGVSTVAHQDIITGTDSIAHQLLERYEIRSRVVSPSFGLYYVQFSPRPSAIFLDKEEQIETLTATGNHYVRKMLLDNFGNSTGARIDYTLAVMPLPDEVPEGKALEQYIESALPDYTSIGKSHISVNRDEFEKIVKEHLIDVFLQPVVSVSDGAIIGYEALSRGPLDSPVREAEALFGTALHLGMRDDIELMCISKIFDETISLPNPFRLFINIGPDLLESPLFFDFLTRRDLDHLLPRVVFELTEHLPIPDAEKLKDALRNLKNLNIALALDDTGCGFSDLNTVDLLRPHIVKLCITVIRRLGRDPQVKKDLLRTVGRIAETGSYVLGEGVEQTMQSEVLKESGVTFAQGFLYGHPRPVRKVFD